MIVRLSQKLAKKIKTAPTRVLPPDANPFADWSAHLFTVRRAQYILLTNTLSLYSMIMYGAGITDDNNFLRRGLSLLREFMVDDRQESIYQRFIAPSTNMICFSKAINRSVIGSMNDLVQCSQHWLTDEELSPYDVSFKLNDMPMSILDYAKPREAFKLLELESSAGEAISS
jgi:hypothetical protein